MTEPDSTRRRRISFRPIKTVYRGVEFRSRLEARWAFYFDLVGLTWAYEMEGFQLTNGEAYLPDFYLPSVGVWAEVKPSAFTQAEVERCADLFLGTGRDVLLLAGPPAAQPYPLLVRRECPEGDPFHPAGPRYALPPEVDCCDALVDASKLQEGRLYTCTGSDWGSHWTSQEDDAAWAARSFSFDPRRGQNGRWPPWAPGPTLRAR